MTQTRNANLYYTVFKIWNRYETDMHTDMHQRPLHVLLPKSLILRVFWLSCALLVISGTKTVISTMGAHGQWFGDKNVDFRSPFLHRITVFCTVPMHFFGDLVQIWWFQMGAHRGGPLKSRFLSWNHQKRAGSMILAKPHEEASDHCLKCLIRKRKYLNLNTSI